MLSCKALPAIADMLYNINLHVGEYKMSCRSNDFAGWLKCDGRSMSRASYGDLFNIIGTSFGASDSYSFNLPDTVGRVMGSVGHGAGLTTRNIGLTLGEETHLLTSLEMPSHNHTGTTNSNGLHAHAITDPGHTHSQTTINDDFNGSGGNPPGFIGDSTGTRTWDNINSSTTGIIVNNNGSHAHTFTTGNTGGGNSHNNMQPTAFIGNIFVFSGTILQTIYK